MDKYTSCIAGMNYEKLTYVWTPTAKEIEEKWKIQWWKRWEENTEETFEFKI